MALGCCGAGVEGRDEVIPGRALVSMLRSKAGDDDDREDELPETVDAERHEVVHLIVRLGDIGEDTSDATFLLVLGDSLIAEVCAPLLLGR